MLSLLLISMTNMAMAANPQCLAALDKLCVDAKGSAACMTCESFLLFGICCSVSSCCRRQADYGAAAASYCWWFDGVDGAELCDCGNLFLLVVLMVLMMLMVAEFCGCGNRCVKGNAAALKAVGCRIIDEDKFCGDSPKPGPKPVSDKCTAALSKSCAAEQQKGEAVCDQCVEKVDKASKLNCSHVEELKFCDKAPKPAPVDQKCEMELIAACAPVGGNKGTTAECDACVKKNLGSLKVAPCRHSL